MLSANVNIFFHISKENLKKIKKDFVLVNMCMNGVRRKRLYVFHKISIERICKKKKKMFTYRYKDENILVAYCKTMNCVVQALCHCKDDW